MTHKEYMTNPVTYNRADAESVKLHREEGARRHREYNAQFVDENVKKSVLRVIGKKDILNSTDPYFNDIPLRKWDWVFIQTPKAIADKMKELGDYPTKAGLVCIAKEAARQIKEEN